MLSADAEEWVRAHVAPVGETVTLHERPWATVRRLPTADGVVWFKACAPSQAFEPRLTAALAGRWGERLPEVLGVDEERAWLLLGDAGEPIGFDVGLSPWLAVLPRYADLQRGEAAHADEHLEHGVPDRGLDAFPTLYRQMLDRALPFSRDERGRFERFEEGFVRLCGELSARGLPSTIQHDDLHGANVYGTGGTNRILDWGDSCVSHPFLTGFVTFLHVEEIGGSGAGTVGYRRLREAYLEPWGRPSELNETFDLAFRIGAFAHLFKELRVLDAIPEGAGSRYAPSLSVVVESCLEAIG